MGLACATAVSAPAGPVKAQPPTGTAVVQVEPPSSNPFHFRTSSGGFWLERHVDDEVLIRDQQGQAVVYRLSGVGLVTATALSPDRSIACIASLREAEGRAVSSLEARQVATGQLLWRRPLEARGGAALAGATSCLVVIDQGASKPATLRWFDLRDGAPLGEGRRGSHIMYGIDGSVPSPDGKWLIASVEPANGPRKQWLVFTAGLEPLGGFEAACASFTSDGRIRRGPGTLFSLPEAEGHAWQRIPPAVEGECAAPPAQATPTPSPPTGLMADWSTQKQAMLVSWGRISADGRGWENRAWWRPGEPLSLEMLPRRGEPAPCSRGMIASDSDGPDGWQAVHCRREWEEQSVFVRRAPGGWRRVPRVDLEMLQRLEWRAQAGEVTLVVYDANAGVQAIDAQTLERRWTWGKRRPVTGGVLYGGFNPKGDRLITGLNNPDEQGVYSLEAATGRAAQLSAAKVYFESTSLGWLPDGRSWARLGPLNVLPTSGAFDQLVIFSGADAGTAEQTLEGASAALYAFDGGFVQRLLAPDRFRVLDSEGHWRVEVGVDDDGVFAWWRDGAFACSGGACRHLRCTVAGESRPIDDGACAQSRRSAPALGVP
jgi:hypothetical protein